MPKKINRPRRSAWHCRVKEDLSLRTFSCNGKPQWYSSAAHPSRSSKGFIIAHLCSFALDTLGKMDIWAIVKFNLVPGPNRPED